MEQGDIQRLGFFLTESARRLCPDESLIRLEVSEDPGQVTFFLEMEHLSALEKQVTDALRHLAKEVGAKSGTTIGVEFLPLPN